MTKKTRYFDDYASAYNYYGGTSVPSGEIALVGNGSYIFVSSDNSYTGGNTQYFDANMTNDEIVSTMTENAYTAGTSYGYDLGYTAGTAYGEAIGYTTGHDAGYNEGYSYGYSYGYDLGYIAGQASVPTTQYTLTLNNTGGGTVSGGGTYNAGTTVTIEAIADTGYVFASWWDASSLDMISDSSTYSFELNRNMSIDAYFNRLYTLTVSSDDLSQGTVSGGGSYITGTSVTVSAQPLAGYEFEGWYENGSLVSSMSTWTFALNNDTDLVAYFRLEGLHTVSVSYNSAEGSATGGGSYSVGDTVTITASPESGYVFDMMVVDAVEQIYSNPYSFTMPDQNLSIEVYFTISTPEPEPTPTPETEVCQACGGTGFIDMGEDPITGIPMTESCTVCGGTGRVPVA